MPAFEMGLSSNCMAWSGYRIGGYGVKGGLGVKPIGTGTDVNRFGLRPITSVAAFSMVGWQ